MNPQQNPVPRLDLAPKLKRPLSLLNPLDYLRLLYWVFYFPQAIRWYVETFGNQEKKNNTSKTKYQTLWQEVWVWLRENLIDCQLYIEGLALTLITSVLMGGFIEGMGIPIDLANIAFVVGLSFLFGVAFSVAYDIAFGVAYGVAFGVAGGIGLGVADDIASGVAYGVVFGIAGSVAGAVQSGVKGGVDRDVRAVFFPGGLVILGFFLSVALNLGEAVLGSVVYVMATWRPENWLFSLWFRVLKPSNKSWGFIHVTALTVPGLASQVKTWLQQDWQMGVHNVNQLLAYTLQYIPVLAAVNLVLEQTPPEKIISRVAHLAENPFDWKLMRFSSASIETIFYVVYISSDIRLDTCPRAVAAGFWYLHEQKPEKAAEAFEVVRQLLYGEEMYCLAEILAAFSQAQKITAIALIQIEALNLTSLPPPEKRLRPVTWECIDRLNCVITEIRTIQNTFSGNARSFALNRAQGELQRILDQKENLPQAERELIIDIAETWQKALLTIAGEVGKITITEPVKIPYVIGNPVEGSLFVGREDILRQLEELWIEANRLQSVVLFGHRRMGKTSILKNVNACLGDGVKLAYVNLQTVGNNPEGVGEVLMAICDEVAEIVNMSPPGDEDLLNLPYPTFRRFLRQVEKVLGTPPNPPLVRGGEGEESPQTPLSKGGFEEESPQIDRVDKGGLREESPQTPLSKGGLREEDSPQIDGVDKGGLREGSPQTDGVDKGGLREESPQTPLSKGGLRGLIIALDEFEVIEDLINTGKIEPGFMGMLRARVQGSSKIAFAFAGLHTLEEMTEDYFQPFFASIIPIPVGFLSRGSTRQLLANPDEDFLLDYQPEALDFIYDLTFGQPFLVQLVGFQLVRHYNQQVFETGRSRDPLFTVADVEAAIADPEFYQRGRYYFTGVWSQAEQDVPGQQDILQLLAPHREGLPVEIVREMTGLDEVTFSGAIDMLKRHDVVEKKAGNLRIMVELFRRWVILELEKEK